MGWHRYIKYRGKNRRAYEYLQRSVWDPAKQQSRADEVYIGPTGGTTNKAVREAYHEVLRENVYLYGRSRPAERYAREAAARAEYHRMLKEGIEPRDPAQTMRDALNRAQEATQALHVAQDEYKTKHAPDVREQSYRVSHPSPQARAEMEHADRKAAAEAELAAERSKIAQDEREEVEATQPTAPPNPYQVDDEIEARQEAFEKVSEEYTAMANAEDEGSS